MEEKRKYFVCIAAGSNPQQLMEDYNEGNVSEEKIIYYKEDAAKMKEAAKAYFSLVKQESYDTLDEYKKKYLDSELEAATEMSDEDYFKYKTRAYDHDKDGNAVTIENLNGKWSRYQIGENFSIPFTLKDGSEQYSALKGDVDWDKMLNKDKELFERTWELVMDNSEPANESEKTIYENMKRRENYLKSFGNKDIYVASNAAFWGFAFVSEETGWMEMEDNVDQFVWMTQYYNMFIKPLPDDTLLTIFECKRQ